VLASFEKLWRKNAATWAQPQEQQNYVEYQTVEGRCSVLMRPEQVVGGAYQRIKMALMRGMRDRMWFVEFEKLTSSPRETTKGIYDFLGEPWFGHDFGDVEQVTTEDDFMHGIPGLHIIRSKIEPMEPQWPKILGSVAAKYAPYNNLWRGLTADLAAPAPVADVGSAATKRKKSARRAEPVAPSSSAR
jgi:hypothetical protein